MILNKSLLAAVCLATLAFAADPWKGKKPADWDEKEIKRVLTNSPWAKSSAMDFDSSRMQQGGGRGRGGAGGWGGAGGGAGAGAGGGAGGSWGGGGMGGRGGGGGMGGRGGDVGSMDGPSAMEHPKVLVRWESAPPIRDAWLKAEEGFSKQLATWSEQYYVISASGMGGGGGNWRGGGEGQPQGDPNWFQNRLKETTVLTPKGKDGIHPDQVKMIRTPTGMMTVFLFPRSAEISMDDRELLFETAMGPMTVKSKFNLSDMKFDGKLAL